MSKSNTSTSDDEDTYVFYVTEKGYHVYLHNGKRIAMSKIPSENLKNIEQIPIPDKSKKSAENRYKARTQSKEDVPPKQKKNDVPPHFRKEKKQKSTPGYNPPPQHEQDEQNIPTYNSQSYLTAADILNKENIRCKKDYYKWLLLNHPDKNPNSDSEYVGTITSAYNLIIVD